MGGASTRITQTLLILVMIVSLGMSTLVGKIANYDGAEYFSRHLHIAFSTIGLLLIWAAFMLARTFVALDSPARSSEVMFYLLNVMPLILVVGVMTVLNAPLTYNFQLTSNWKWVS
ncbi:hypothetical protein LPJ66_000870 [Kickxella alabastrina]|uniref:Uncharacterized protein n=1 Tax=Kickxella alabastrina TaxID=61397 RepID=A0ACC1IV41_9FUNG|nr:hypothetical protein LPJ66_000870 [Kickxella alabastrina]